MKKYTNKILLITLILIAVLFVVGGTVEVQTAWRSGKIKKFGEGFHYNQQDDETYFLENPADADTITSDMMKNKDVNF